MDKTTLKEIDDIVKKIVDEREWDQFHNIKNLSMNLVRESTELMELFTWASDEDANKIVDSKREDIEGEIADVFFTLFMVCQKTNTNLKDAFLKKVEILKKKYPVEKCKGKNLKYTEL